MKAFLLAIGLLATLAPVHAQTLERIKATKTITIAHRSDATPFSFDLNGEPVGYTTDICRRVVASIERALNIADLKIKWVPATADNRIDLVASKKADMECGATTATLSRMEKVDFSNLVFVDGGALMALKTGGYKSLGDLAGKKIAVLGGTSTEKSLGIVLRERNIDAQILPVKTREEGVTAVESGAAGAFASDAIMLSAISIKAQDLSKLEQVGTEMFSYEPYAIVLPQGDAQFRLAVNRALARLYRSGDISQIFNKYFGGIGSPSPLLVAAYFLGALPE